SLQKNGAGSLVLSGSNTYTGGTSASNGTLSISADSNLGAPASSVTFGTGALDTQGNTSAFGNVTGNGTLRKLGSGSLILNSLRVGTLTIDNGTVAISSGRDALNKSSKLNGLGLAAGSALDLN